MVDSLSEFQTRGRKKFLHREKKAKTGATILMQSYKLIIHEIHEGVRMCKQSTPKHE
jgi:hypothetical protein